MSKNRTLNKASIEKNDEFYTRLEDIENELKHYKNHFKGKIILCNCDDPYESEFFKYFAKYFNVLGLKKLIATNYVGSPIFQTELNYKGTPNEFKNFNENKHAVKVEIVEVKDFNEDGRVDLLDVEYLLKNKKNVLTLLQGDAKFAAGDFRSEECIECLKEADIVVTNPPFSLFRKYVKQLIDFDKKFLIIGNQNAVTYKDFFPLVKENKIWLGYGFQRDPHFKVPDYYEERATRFWIDETGQKWRSFGNMCWYTNLDVKKRHEDIKLGFLYEKNPEKYPKYDNYDIIDVSKIIEIPSDYFGVMGVPITFLDKYNPEQFEILGIANSARWIGYECYTFINGKKIYNRILIRRR